MNTEHSALPSGFMLIQGNRLECLCDLLVAWLKRHPLPPLENDVVLVQSNGIAQWLKLAIAADAQGCGIAAGLTVTLPGRFIWQAYRQVLGDLPHRSPFDKEPLTWRLYRLLGNLNALNGIFAPLTDFLHGEDTARRRHQLATKLADLFDQYQVYRADWLTAWQNGDDSLIRPNGNREPLPAAQRWQPALWRLLMTDIQLENSGLPQFTTASRATIHHAFLERLRTASASRLPRRIIVFGISALPRQSLEVLAAIAAHAQVLLFAHNPSRHYWGDLIAERELFRQDYRRHPPRQRPPITDAAALHVDGHPLLAAWGKQGRDYLRLLDEHDQRSQYEAHFQAAKMPIDLFESFGNDTLLHQLQDDILELRTLAERQALHTAINPATDRSVEFLIAHSPLREVEILHDQLLDAFAQAEKAGTPLAPRDVLVMVPDINGYASAVTAVFKRRYDDPRRNIPFHLADQGSTATNPILIGLRALLNLPQARFSVTELMDLLDIAALRERFGIDSANVPQLRRWISGANIRWGLSAEHRASLGFPPALTQNTWQFGLQRMLLGFASGASDAWQGIEPYDEVGGLDAALIGPLVQLLDALAQVWTTLQTSRSPTHWVTVLAQMLDDLFIAVSDTDQLALARVRETLERWAEDCTSGELTEDLPLEVVREVVLARLDQPTLTQRFFAGAVNFATLMPMRAIPFRHIWLLGMNDGDYPRNVHRADFDLMADDYRPGDRARREDDRYLFLEALLSARERLVISWVGRSIRDDSTRPPSVLVGQLRDHLAAGWQLAESGTNLLDALTTEHPLQPFSARYFQPQRSPRLFTYASEWRAAHFSVDSSLQSATAVPISNHSLTTDNCQLTTSLSALGLFLRQPLKTFYTQRLGLYFNVDDGEPLDDEQFAVDSLDNWQLGNALLEAVKTALTQNVDVDIERCLRAAANQLARAGALPLPPFADALIDTLLAELTEPATKYQALLQQFSRSCSAETVRLALLNDTLNDIRTNANGERVLLQLQASQLFSGKTPKWTVLVRIWPLHLAAQFGGATFTRIFGRKSEFTLHPLAAEMAREHLLALMNGYQQALSQPLPLACNTGFAAFASSGDAVKAYEGGQFNAYQFGDCASHSGYRRFWPTYAQLAADQRFAPLVAQLYQPLFDHIRRHAAAKSEI
ncbi:exodeoxyribonuclease V subunit gamma [Chromatium weissei]|nr:exodeoxyribonuclease V subunit gamma [Chromatium weissei]